MFLILPVQSLLLYTTVGVSTYSLVSWLLSLHPIEMILYTSILSTLTSIGCILFLYTHLSDEDSLDRLERRMDRLETNPVYCMECGKSFGISSETGYTSQHRVVVEQDGTLVITTRFSPEDISVDETVEEIRETLSKEEPPPSPVEETAEFSELLEETLKKE